MVSNLGNFFCGGGDLNPIERPVSEQPLGPIAAKHRHIFKLILGNIGLAEFIQLGNQFNRIDMPGRPDDLRQ